MVSDYMEALPAQADNRKSVIEFIPRQNKVANWHIDRLRQRSGIEHSHVGDFSRVR